MRRRLYSTSEPHGIAALCSSVSSEGATLFAETPSAGSTELRKSEFVSWKKTTHFLPAASHFSVRPLERSSTCTSPWPCGFISSPQTPLSSALTASRASPSWSAGTFSCLTIVICPGAAPKSAFSASIATVAASVSPDVMITSGSTSDASPVSARQRSCSASRYLRGPSGLKKRRPSPSRPRACLCVPRRSRRPHTRRADRACTRAHITREPSLASFPARDECPPRPPTQRTCPGGSMAWSSSDGFEHAARPHSTPCSGLVVREGGRARAHTPRAQHSLDVELQVARAGRELGRQRELDALVAWRGEAARFFIGCPV